jgi:hypothetical protein
LPDDVLGEFCERDSGDADGSGGRGFDICGLDWKRMLGNWDLRSYGNCGDGGDGHIQHDE